MLRYVSVLNRILLSAVVLVALPGCYGLRATLGTSWRDAHQFHASRDDGIEVAPVVHVEERFHAVNVFGYPASRVDLDRALAPYLSDERYLISNWQVASGTYNTYVFDYFFTISYMEVSFDVVERVGR